MKVFILSLVPLIVLFSGAAFAHGEGHHPNGKQHVRPQGNHGHAHSCTLPTSHHEACRHANHDHIAHADTATT